MPGPHLSALQRAAIKNLVKKKTSKYLKKGRKAPAKKARRRAGASKVHLVQDVGIGGQTTSACRMPSNRGSEMTRAICNVGQKQRAMYNQANELVVNQGTQNYTQYAHAHQSILKQYADAYQNTPAARGQAGGSALSDSVARYVLQSIRSTHTIANQSNVPVLLKIYDIGCRRDTQNVMDYTSPNGNVFSWNGSPGTAWDVGLNAGSDTVIPPPIPYSSQYGTVPTGSAVFNKYFKINKQTTIELAVGAIHRHVFSRTYNKLMDASVYGMTEGYGIVGITDFQLFVLCGTPVTLIGTVEPTVGQDVGQTSSIAKVAIITDTEAVYTFGSPFGQTIYLDNDVFNNIPLGSRPTAMVVGNPTIDAPLTT